MKAKPPEEKGGSTENARRLKSNTKSLRNETSSVNTFGSPELCAWRVGPGTCRFQTTSPGFARKLSQRSGAKLVGCTVSGGYLRIFQEAIEPWRARNLVTRYITAANGVFSRRVSRQSASETGGRVKTAGGVTGGPS
jgi:hypothetical protein